MLSADYELIAGVSREGDLGHFLVVGLGGIYSEILDDVLLFPAGVSRERLRSDIAASRIGRIATQGRDDHGAVVDCLADVLESLQTLVLSAGDRIESIDVNPILVRDGVCTAVDALVVLRAAGADENVTSGVAQTV
jgi:hypothetical protein